MKRPLVYTEEQTEGCYCVFGDWWGMVFSDGTEVLSSVFPEGTI